MAPLLAGISGTACRTESRTMRASPLRHVPMVRAKTSEWKPVLAQYIAKGVTSASGGWQPLRTRCVVPARQMDMATAQMAARRPPAAAMTHRGETRWAHTHQTRTTTRTGSTGMRIRRSFVASSSALREWHRAPTANAFAFRNLLKPEASRSPHARRKAEGRDGTDKAFERSMVRAVAHVFDRCRGPGGLCFHRDSRQLCTGG